MLAVWSVNESFFECAGNLPKCTASDLHVVQWVKHRGRDDVPEIKSCELWICVSRLSINAISFPLQETRAPDLCCTPQTLKQCRSQALQIAISFVPRVQQHLPSRLSALQLKGLPALALLIWFEDTALFSFCWHWLLQARWWGWWCSLGSVPWTRAQTGWQFASCVMRVLRACVSPRKQGNAPFQFHRVNTCPTSVFLFHWFAQRNFSFNIQIAAEAHTCYIYTCTQKRKGVASRSVLHITGRFVLLTKHRLFVPNQNRCCRLITGVTHNCCTPGANENLGGHILQF